MDDPALRKQLYRSVTEAPLDAGDPRYVDLYSDRAEDPVRRLAEHIEFLEVESFQMFSGFRGSGKTTELFRLRDRLKSNGFVVLYADALEYLNPAAPLDITTLLLALAGSFNDALADIGAADCLKEGYWARLTHFLSTTKVSISEVTVKAGEVIGAAEFKLALRESNSFRQVLADALGGRLSELVSQVRTFFQDGLQAIREFRGERVRTVFLFDQLEQIRGSAFDQDAVIRSVDALFANHKALLKIPNLHVVYTVPPWLKFVLPGESIELLSTLGLWQNDAGRSPRPEACSKLREVIVRRFGPDSFERFFGSISEDTCPLADQLVCASGGSFRDLLRLVLETVRAAHNVPVEEAAVHAAIARVRSQYLPLPFSDARWLRDIAELRDTLIEARTSADVSRLSLFLDTHLVLYFFDDKAWYDIHPLIREEVAEIVRRAERLAPGVTA